LPFDYVDVMDFTSRKKELSMELIMIDIGINLMDKQFNSICEEVVQKHKEKSKFELTEVIKWVV